MTEPLTRPFPCSCGRSFRRAADLGQHRAHNPGPHIDRRRAARADTAAPCGDPNCPSQHVDGEHPARADTAPRVADECVGCLAESDEPHRDGCPFQPARADTAALAVAFDTERLGEVIHSRNDHGGEVCDGCWAMAHHLNEQRRYFIARPDTAALTPEEERNGILEEAEDKVSRSKWTPERAETWLEGVRWTLAQWPARADTAALVKAAQAAAAYLAHLDTDQGADNSVLMLEWAATEDRLREDLRAALEATDA